MLIDSHCHLNYLDSLELALKQARSLGIDGFLCVGVDKTGADEVCSLANLHSDVWASVGQHPSATEKQDEWIPQYLANTTDISKIIALGEMGLDYYRCPDDRTEQRRQQKCFEYQLGLAKKLDYPVIIHTRNAEKDTADLLSRFEGVIGVMHCFTESWSLAELALDLGYYVSISGIVTFKNADGVRDVASKIPKDRLLVETDSPWLAPEPHRGKQNQPALVIETAQFLSDYLDWELDDLKKTTTNNFFDLFQRAKFSPRVSY